MLTLGGVEQGQWVAGLELSVEIAYSGGQAVAEMVMMSKTTRGCWEKRCDWLAEERREDDQRGGTVGGSAIDLLAAGGRPAGDYP